MKYYKDYYYYYYKIEVLRTMLASVMTILLLPKGPIQWLQPDSSYRGVLSYEGGGAGFYFHVLWLT
jgi:hypothetical protein